MPGTLIHITDHLQNKQSRREEAEISCVLYQLYLCEICFFQMFVCISAAIDLYLLNDAVWVKLIM